MYVTCCGVDKAVAAVHEALKLTGQQAEVQVVDDIAEIVKAGVMSPPAIKVDGKLIASGRVPKAQDLAKLLSASALR